MNSVHTLSTYNLRDPLWSKSIQSMLSPGTLNTLHILHYATLEVSWVSTFTLHEANLHTHHEEYKYDAYNQAKGVSKQLYSSANPPPLSH
jgi:hypothetical protein